MGLLRFEWDPQKEGVNRRKHGVSFEEAKTVFLDEDALIAFDPEHAQDEERFLIIGFSLKARLLLACFCEREGGDVIRIISARRATPKERRQFSEGQLV